MVRVTSRKLETYASAKRPTTKLFTHRCLARRALINGGLLLLTLDPITISLDEAP